MQHISPLRDISCKIDKRHGSAIAFIAFSINLPSAFIVFMLICISASKELYFSDLNKHSSKFFNIFFMPIHSIFIQSPVGILNVQVSEDYVHAVHFVDTDAGAEEIGINSAMANDTSSLIHKCRRQLDEYFSGERTVFDLPLQQNGSAFQQQVWKGLTDIPFGKTISYLELSKRIGNVKAIRAVGTTNGRNSIAIIVPCHRVIGSDGSLTGYAGGLWRKKWLLNHEARYANGLQTLF